MYDTTRFAKIELISESHHLSFTISLIYNYPFPQMPIPEYHISCLIQMLPYSCVSSFLLNSSAVMAALVVTPWC